MKKIPQIKNCPDSFEQGQIEALSHPPDYMSTCHPAANNPLRHCHPARNPVPSIHTPSVFSNFSFWTKSVDTSWSLIMTDSPPEYGVRSLLATITTHLGTVPGWSLLRIY